MWTESNFWSAEPNSARWTVTLRTGVVRDCSTQARSFLRVLKNAINNRAVNLADYGIWSGRWSTSLRAALATAGLDATARSSVSDDQTRWTPEMLKVAIWYAYYRRTADWNAVTIPHGTILPQSNVAPPDDNQAYSFPAPSCRTAAVPAPPAQPPPAPPRVAPNTLDFSTADFWSADPWSARWIVHQADGTTQWCAISPRMFLRQVKQRLAAGFDPNDRGRWSSEETNRLYRGIRSEGRMAESQIPFTPSTLQWTEPMLRMAIWYTFHLALDPSAIELPTNVALPQMNADAPDDGRGADALVEPSCGPATALTGPTTPVTPVPGAAPPVVLWGASWCPSCQALRGHLTQRGITFTYRDWDTTSQADQTAVNARVRRAGLVPGGIPILEVGDHVLVGFNASRVDELLASQHLMAVATTGTSPWLVLGAFAALGLGGYLLWRAVRSPDARSNPGVRYRDGFRVMAVLRPGWTGQMGWFRTKEEALEWARARVGSNLQPPRDAYVLVEREWRSGDHQTVAQWRAKPGGAGWEQTT